MPILNAVAFERGDWAAQFDFGKAWPCDAPVLVEMLHAVSGRILRDKACRAFPDLATFGYFCRAANTKRALEGLTDRARRFGWGTVVHIAPANIPINFAFSLVMGLLAGNSGIIRLPSRIFPQTELLVDIFDDILARPEFQDIGKGSAFVQTEHDSAQLKQAIARAQGLIVWGGDATIERFRAYEKAPRCAEVYIPNRVSSALLEARQYLDLDATAQTDLARAFYNDSFLVDQNACSSPGIMFWLGDQEVVQRAKSVFWQQLATLLRQEYEIDPVAKIDKVLDVMAINMAAGDPVSITRDASEAWQVHGYAQGDLPLRFGLFIEVELSSLTDLAGYLRPNEQTLTTFGVAPEEVYANLKTDGCHVDRIVPVGQALDIGLLWDGKDMLSTLSRRVQVG